MLPVKEEVLESELRHITEAEVAGYTVGTRAEALEKARALGFEVVLPEPNQLLIDIDDAASEAVFYSQVGILSKYIPVLHLKVTPSKSGGEKQHITATLSRDITPTERVGLQAMLGSDRKRELLSFIRVVQDDEDPTVFFEKPIKPETEDIPF